MDQGPLVTEDIKAGTELIQKLNEVLPIRAAFWLKDSDEGWWYLYLASDHVTHGNVGEGYRKVLQVSNNMPDLFLDLLLVKLIPLDDPLAQAAIDISTRYPSNHPTRYGGSTFGGMSVDGVYIYPASIMAPAQTPAS